MEESNRQASDRGAGSEPSVASTPTVQVDGERRDGNRVERGAGLAASEAFQTLADETRVAVLVELLAAERAGEAPRSFSELQRATGAESSARFAYHLRQLADHFVRKGEGEGESESGYVLTAVGRRAAEAIVARTFTGGPGADASQAS
jgi:DNA-binding transcriptional ArsR family regulator